VANEGGLTAPHGQITPTHTSQSVTLITTAERFLTKSRGVAGLRTSATHHFRWPTHGYAAMRALQRDDPGAKREAGLNAKD
jgi:hypothetical protein